MQLKPEKLLYEYAVVRYVPRVEREEFINIGLVMLCKRRRWVRWQITLPLSKIAAYDCAFNTDTLLRQLAAMEGIAKGEKCYGEIAALPAEERFRWLTAVKSACIQTSRPHPGLTHDLDDTFEKIYAEQVL